MTALLWADWIRYRRRLDLWVITLGLLAFALVGFVSGYRNDATDPVQRSEAELRQMVLDSSFFEGMTQAEIDLQVDQMVRDFAESQERDRLAWEEMQKTTLQKYDLAQAPLTVIGFGIGPLIAAFLIATLIVGDEFRHGTIRTSLLAASDRRRFLGARLITIAAITVALFGALIVLALVLSVGLHLIGAELPPPTRPIDAAAAVGLIGGELLVVFAATALGLALTVLLRSGALPLLLTLIYAFVEAFIAHLPVFAPHEPLAGFQGVFLTSAAQRVIQTLAQASNGLAFEVSLPDDVEHLLPLWVSVTIVAAWLALFVTIADRRLRTMDIVE